MNDQYMKQLVNKPVGGVYSNPAAKSSSTMQMVQNVLLVWLDTNIDEKNKDCQNTLSHLRRVINIINTFTNNDDCIKFLQEIKDDKVCMIISGSLGKHIVPRIHNMYQVDSIFIFSNNKQYHEQWTKNWSKIKGIYTDIKIICDALKHSVKDCEQNAIGFTVVPTGGITSKVDLDRLDSMFMYTQILKEILLEVHFEPKHLLDFTDYCRKILETNNTYQLNDINKFQREYQKQTPIWWYTWESFLYPMLNRALRLANIDVIIKMGFFIGDLHRQIVRLHQQQFNNTNPKKIFTVYRGQGMFKDEFTKMSKTVGGLISFNTFLSTSLVENVSIGFAERALKNPSMMGILFTMKIDSQRSTTPFASVADVGAYQNQENEILFAMHTVFRIRDIKQMGVNTRLFRVKLELISDNDDDDLQVLTKYIREETCLNSRGWHRLSAILLNMRRPKEAEEVIRILLQEETNEEKIGILYNQLGLCKKDQAKYTEAIRFYKKSIEILKKYTPNNPYLVKIYDNIGVAYFLIGKYVDALSILEEALVIIRQSSSHNHHDSASIYNHIGSVHLNVGQYAKALSSYEKAIEIYEQSLSSDNPELAMSYNNIGTIYDTMGDNTKALSFHEKALIIRQKSLPPNHPNLAMSYTNLGTLYFKMGEHMKASSYYAKAHAIQQQSFLPNHSHLAKPFIAHDFVNDKMSYYSKHIEFYEKELATRQQSLPVDHPDLIKLYAHLGNLYIAVGEYSKAYLLYKRTVEIAQRSLPPNHPYLIRYKYTLDRLKNKL